MVKICKDLEEDGDNDRISSLPRDLKDVIMKLLPIRDAARTSILSTRWRYVWANHPSIVLRYEFCDDIEQYLGHSIDYFGIVNKILLHHTGNIEKFAVTFDITCHRDAVCGIDLWLSVLCRKGLKALTLHTYVPDSDPRKLPESDRYTIPSCVFSNSELTYLSFSFCTINTNGTFNGFIKLQSLKLDCVTLKSSNLITPLLTALSLGRCSGIHDFSISAPRLASLTLFINDHLNLIPYLVCPNVTYAYIILEEVTEDNGDHVEIINLQKLLSAWPKLERFTLNESSVKYLTAVLGDFSFTLKLTRLALFITDLGQIARILRIIGNSPCLRTLKFEIPTPLIHLELLKCLEEPSFMNMTMEQLRTVKLRHFSGSRNELQLVKILLHCSPSLEKMYVKVFIFSSQHALKIAADLMRFPRASPKAEIIFEWDELL